MHQIILLFRIYKTLSIPNHKSWGAEIWGECSFPTMWHMSHVTYHMTHVTCHVLGVKCHIFLYDKVVEVVGGGCVINGAYPV